MLLGALRFPIWEGVEDLSDPRSLWVFKLMNWIRGIFQVQPRSRRRARICNDKCVVKEDGWINGKGDKCKHDSPGIVFNWERVQEYLDKSNGVTDESSRQTGVVFPATAEMQ